MGTATIAPPMIWRCAHCNTTLRPGFDGRPRCPLFGSCGKDGGLETRAVLARWRFRRAYLRGEVSYRERTRYLRARGTA